MPRVRSRNILLILLGCGTRDYASTGFLGGACRRYLFSMFCGHRGISIVPLRHTRTHTRSPAKVCNNGAIVWHIFASTGVTRLQYFRGCVSNLNFTAASVALRWRTLAHTVTPGAQIAASALRKADARRSTVRTINRRACGHVNTLGALVLVCVCVWGFAQHTQREMCACIFYA